MTTAVLRRYPLTLAFVAVIFVLCLMPIPETPLDEVRFIDKWTHIGMYFVLVTLFWGEHYRNSSNLNGMRLLIAGVVLPTLLGGIIELMQATLTTCRSGEWLDFAADAVGAILGATAGRILMRRLFGRNRKNHVQASEH